MSLTWTLDFRVNDNPLRATSKELVQFHDRLGRTRDLLASVETASGKTTFNLTRLSDALGRMAVTGAAVALGALTVALGAAGAALWKFGETANQAFSERTSTLRAYTTLLGSAAAAEKEFAKAQALSQRTDLTSSQVEGITQKLLVSGFRDRGLDQARAGILDLATFAAPEKRTQIVEQLSKAFSDVATNTKLQGEELNQFREAGLSKGLIIQELVKAGVGKDAAAVEKAISKGKVAGGTDSVAIAAIERAILAQIGTGKLGEYAVGSSGSVAGLESNRAEAFKNLLKSFDSEQLPAVRAYKEALTEATAATSLESESGQNLKVVLEDLSNVGIGLHAAWTDFTTGFLDSAGAAWLAALTQMGYTIEGSEKNLGNLRDVARDAGEAIGKLGGAAAYIVHAFEAAGSVLKELGADIKWAATHPMDALMGAGRQERWDSARGQWSMVGEDYDARRLAAWRGEGGAPKPSESADADVYTEVDGKLVQVRHSTTKEFGPFAGPGDLAPSKKAAALKRAGASGAAGGGGGGGSGSGGDSYTRIGAVVNLGGVTIEVQGGKAHSPAEIADEVEQRLVRMVGRYARNPSKEIV